MSTLSRWKNRLFHRTLDTGLGSPDNLGTQLPAPIPNRPEVERHSSQSASSRPSICRRCEDLQLCDYIERQWTVLSYALPLDGFRIARIYEATITKTCALCTQFEKFLEHPDLVRVHNGTKQNRSLELWCRYFSRARGTAMYFYIPYHDSATSLCLFPMRSQAYEASLMGSLAPFSRQPVAEDVFVRTLSARSCQIAFVRLDRAKKWFEDCNKLHRDSYCSRAREDAIKPDRVIDCKRMRLCRTAQPYVCLSYVWGPSPVAEEDFDDITIGDLPWTIRDAMTVTLELGLRYLWVDRYCINQDDPVEKHNIITNMDAICKSDSVP
jgi:hypothetical protein